MIYDNDNKNERVDARTLARLARVDTELLHPVRHRRAEAQADLKGLTIPLSRSTLLSIDKLLEHATLAGLRFHPRPPALTPCSDLNGQLVPAWPRDLRGWFAWTSW